MNKYLKLFSIAALLGVSFSGFSAEKSTYEIKSEFIEKMNKPANVHKNDYIYRRSKLLAIAEKRNDDINPSKSDEVFLSNLGEKFDINHDDYESLSLVVDRVPASIIIAVAIVESEWGTDELLEKANNPFNIRCYKIGCGIADSRSNMEGIYSEISTFSTITDATRSFANNINTNSMFSSFREERKRMRDNGEYLTGLPLAQHVVSFNEKETKYGSKLRQIIHSNKLYYLDE